MSPVDTTTALIRLNTHLPLAERQAALTDHHRELHRSILRWFADHGTAPLAADLGIDRAGFDRAIGRLARRDLVVVVDGRITGAYPFTTEATVHRVSLGGVEVRAMCSLDAVAMAPLFGRPALIESTCAIGGDSVRIEMVGQTVVSAAPPDVHIGIGFQETHGCAASSLCRDMVFLADRREAQRWQGEGGDRAPIFDLEAAVGLAVRFFGPLLGAGAVV
jgi:alkylmercury lyase